MTRIQIELRHVNQDGNVSTLATSGWSEVNPEGILQIKKIVSNLNDLDHLRIVPDVPSNHFSPSKEELYFPQSVLKNCFVIMRELKNGPQ